MSNKYRDKTADAPTPGYGRPVPKKITPGTLDPHHIPIFDHKGNARGHVGPKATSAVINHFGVSGAKLGRKNGAPAWIGAKPQARSSSRDAQARQKRTGQLAQAKGSNTTLAGVSAQGSATPGSTANTLAGRSSRGATATQVKPGG